MSSSNTTLDLVANTLDSNLHTLPTKLIGQKSLIFNALCFLGIKARKEAFRDLSKTQSMWKCSKKATTSPSTTLQHFSKKAMVNPSRPGALSPKLHGHRYEYNTGTDTGIQHFLKNKDTTRRGHGN